MIGGFRSGSTLLAGYLGLHPQVSAIYETKFLVHLLRIVRLVEDDAGRGRRELELMRGMLGTPALTHADAVGKLVEWAQGDIARTQHVLDGRQPDGKAPHERYVLGSDHILWTDREALDAIAPFVAAVRAGEGAETLRSSLGAATTELFGLHAGREGKSRWVNKTPEIPRFQPELSRIFGRCRVIHLVRDGRDVVRSAVELKWWSVEVAAHAWRTFVEDVRSQASGHPEDHLELRYEDLVTDHAGTLGRVLAFLGLPGDAREFVDAQERFAPGSTSREAAERSIGRWRSELAAGDRETVRAIAGDLLESLGYARDDAS